MNTPTIKIQERLARRPRPSRLVRVGIVLFFLLVIFDGALRKWAFPSQSAVLFVLKDFVLWAAFLWYALRRDPFELPGPIYKTWLPVLLTAYISIVLLQAFNIRQPSPIVSAIGLKIHLAYLPLIVLVPPIVAQITEKKLTRFLWGYTILIVLPIVGLSIYQFTQPRTAWVNTYLSRSSTDVAMAGEHVRITGPFSYMHSYAKYIHFNAALGIGSVIAGIRWGRRKITLSGAIITLGTLITLPMLGSRSTVFIIVCGVIGLLVIMKRRGYLISIIVASLAIAFIASETLGTDSVVLEGWKALGYRVQTSGIAQDRIEKFSLAPVTGIGAAGVFGYGVGTNYQATPTFISKSDWEGRIKGDNRVLRILVELGVIGFLILTTLKLFLLYLASKTVRRSRSIVEFIVGATAFSVLLAHVLLPVVYNVVISAFYWGLVGAMIGIWGMQEVSKRHGF